MIAATASASHTQILAGLIEAALYFAALDREEGFMHARAAAFDLAVGHEDALPGVSLFIEAAGKDWPTWEGPVAMLREAATTLRGQSEDQGADGA